MKQMAEDANSLPINRVEYNDLSVGFITNGIAYQYVKEAMPQASVLKLGLLNPPSRKLIEEFAAKVDKLYIFEELEPVVEEQVKSGAFRRQWARKYSRFRVNESANLIRRCAGPRHHRWIRRGPGSCKTSILCPGCPHRKYTLCLTN